VLYIGKVYCAETTEFHWVQFAFILVGSARMWNVHTQRTCLSALQPHNFVVKALYENNLSHMSRALLLLSD
jgi:hypothetical protein